MIAGELPSDPAALSEGSGPVLIDSNVISTNLANDDGGGIRLLQTSGSHITRANPQTITISNNTVTDNVSAHEGGGLAFDDAAFVDVVNNTVARNLTTATAITSDGQPAPAGLSTAANSDPLMARLRRLRRRRTSCGTTAVRQADPAQQRVLGQPGRQLQRWLRLRHRRPAAGRRGERRQQLGHGRGRRPRRPAGPGELGAADHPGRRRRADQRGHRRRRVSRTPTR